MNINKDEARILAEAISVAKHEWATLPNGGFAALGALEKRLETFGKDKRRNGRTTQDSWNDCLKRFISET